jgi:transcriptional regulator with GAF, ATPase, and Fis domain
MVDPNRTRDNTPEFERPGEEPIAGVVIVFSGSTPRLSVLALEDGVLRIGRDEAIGLLTADERLSRRHAELRCENMTWQVADLGSRNGTFLDARQVHGRVNASAGSLLRMGKTLLQLSNDIRPFQGRQVTVERDVVLGPRFGAALDAIASEAARGAPLLIQGETGTGKEIAARAAHRAGPGAKGPFVAVNCATIPEGLAERLFFGAKRGAYSGAMGDSEGYVQAAEGGMLFLDEIGELGASVQAKLLRVLESHEFTPLGSPKSVRTNASFCSATHRDLRADVAAGRFRADLYYRLGQHQSRLPPLRDRAEEIPWLIAGALGAGVELHIKMIEACMLRPWPGNVRELLRETLLARQRAERAKASCIGLEHLGSAAGLPMESAPQAGQASSPAGLERPEPSREEIEAALEREDGNVSAAARSLGLHRTQLRRILVRFSMSTPKA